MTPLRRPRPHPGPASSRSASLPASVARRARCRAAAILAAALFVACSPPPPERRPRAEAPRRGGTAIVATHQDIAGVNDLVSGLTSLTEEILGQMFLDLFDEQDDFTEHPPTFRPRLAESYEFSADRLTLTVRLRPDVRWSDGAPVTAEDVRFTWQAQTDPRVAWGYAQSKEHIEDVEVVDDRTVRFHFDSAYATQLQDANEGVILPHHAWSRLPFEQWPESEQWFQDNLVVDGPFVMTSWKPQEEFVLERNPAYYEPDLPRLDRVVFRVVPDRANHITQLLRGEVDFVPRVDTDKVELIEASDAAVLYPYWHRQYTYLGWNTARPLFAAAEVRRALTMAIDRQTIIDTLRQGWAKVGTSPILSSVWASAGLEPWPYDPPAAAEILRRHGWQKGADGILTRDGVRFSFTLATDAASRSWRDTAAMIQEQLRLIGIEVLIQPMELNTLLARLGEHDFDATMGSWGIDTSLDLKYAFHTDSIDGGYNFGGYSDPRVDELIDEAKRQLDPHDAGPLLREIQEILHRDQPYTFLWEPQRISAMAVRLRDARPNSVSTYQNLREWWIAE